MNIEFCEGDDNKRLVNYRGPLGIPALQKPTANKLAIIALKYLEPDYSQTLDCLEKAAMSYPVFFADRDGVGNMSRAFNDAFEKHVKGKFDYVWFVTNVVFEPVVINRMLKIADAFDLSGIHPSMKSSDHVHLWPDGSDVARVVPFIEFTAPLFKCSVFEKFMLCEQTPYYYMDLIICHQITISGGTVAVDNGSVISHTYLRNNISDHPISSLRKKLRNYWTPLSKKYMVDTYGIDWETTLWPK